MEKVRKDSAAIQENQESIVHAKIVGDLIDFSKIEIFSLVN